MLECALMKTTKTRLKSEPIESVQTTVTADRNYNRYAPANKRQTERITIIAN